MAVHVFNLDPGWGFSTLVIEQALDLFPLSSGVEMVDLVPPEKRGSDLKSLFLSWPDWAGPGQITGFVQRFIDSVEHQEAGARDSLVLCIGWEALKRFQPVQAAASQEAAEQSAPKTEGVKPSFRGEKPPKFATGRMVQVAQVPKQPEPEARPISKAERDPMSEVLDVLKATLGTPRSTAKSFTFTLFCAVNGEQQEQIAIEAAKRFLASLPQPIRWRTSVVICVDDGAIDDATKFTYLRTLIDMLQEVTARSDKSPANLYGKLFVQEEDQHHPSGSVLRLSKLQFGTTLSASIISTIAMEIHAAATNTSDPSTTEEKEESAEKQVNALIKDLISIKNTLLAGTQGPTTLPSANPKASSPVPANLLGHERSDFKDVDITIQKTKQALEDVAKKRLEEISKAFNKAEEDLAKTDNGIEKHAIDVGVSATWRREANDHRSGLLETSRNLADLARSKRKTNAFLTVTKNSGGEFVLDLDKVTKWKQTKTDIEDHIGLKKESLSYWKTILLWVLIAIAVWLVSRAPYGRILDGAYTAPNQLFIITVCIAFIFVLMIIFALITAYTHGRKVIHALNGAKSGAGNVEADLQSAADSIESSRMAAIVSGHYRILARKMRTAVAQSEAVKELKDLVPNAPPVERVDSEIKSLFFERFRAVQSEKDKAARIGQAIVDTIDFLREAESGASGIGPTGSIDINGDDGIAGYPIRASFSMEGVKIHVEKK